MVILHTSFRTLLEERAHAHSVWDGMGWGGLGPHTSQGPLKSRTFPETLPVSTGQPRMSSSFLRQFHRLESPRLRSEKHEQPTDASRERRRRRRLSGQVRAFTDHLLDQQHVQGSENSCHKETCLALFKISQAFWSWNLFLVRYLLTSSRTYALPKWPRTGPLQFKRRSVHVFRSPACAQLSLSPTDPPLCSSSRAEGVMRAGDSPLNSFHLGWVRPCRGLRGVPPPSGGRARGHTWRCLYQLSEGGKADKL